MIQMDNIIIRSMKEEDSAEVLEMMRVFYASPALLSDPSEDVMKRDIADCLGDNPFIECFVFENNTGVIMGYSMVAHSYSTECGGNCVWVEDIYIKPDYRGKNIAGEFFEHLDNMYGKEAGRHAHYEADLEYVPAHHRVHAGTGAVQHRGQRVCLPAQ